ncbi:Nn.00g089950.m01.CDS01 [Neocucurbitaria sp. VM-36]
MMRKKTQYTNITPIPSFIPRQLAIDFLHSHGEIIELNPLVTGHEAIKAPRDAPADEFYSTWYEISQRIQYIPGIGKMGSGAIKFRGVFHDLPFGLQTHTYAPANVDLRNKWQICGNQPGEPPEPKELGSGAPPEGLYIREDVEIKCNVTMVSFVKKEMKAAAKIMLERLVKKAELLDSGALQGLMENGKLKTVNPADRSYDYKSPQPSPTHFYNMPQSPNRSPTFPRNSQYGQPGQHIPPQHLLGNNNVVMELPGDYYHPQSSPGLLHPNDSNNRFSTATDSSTTQYSPNAPDARWSTVSHSSASSRPSSYAPSESMRSPGLEQKAFAAELPTMEETREEHDDRRKRESQLPGEQQKYTYNPQDYARTQAQYASAPPYSSYSPNPNSPNPYSPNPNQGR